MSQDRPEAVENDEWRTLKNVQTLDRRLEEKDQEIAIVKEAFEQSLAQLDEISVGASSKSGFRPT